MMWSGRRASLLWLSAVLLVCVAHGFYLPGVAPTDYSQGDAIEFRVNSLDSVRTQLPYEFYSLPFCKPQNRKKFDENIGEILTGDRIERAAYEANMRMTESCKILCKRHYSDAQLHRFADRVREEYYVNMIVDNIPAVTKYLAEYVDSSGQPHVEPWYQKGYALGFKGGKKAPQTSENGAIYLNNHLRVTLLFHEEANQAHSQRIVGFEVEPFSVAHDYEGDWMDDSTALRTCNPQNNVKVSSASVPLKIDPSSGGGMDVIWTYDIRWEKSPVKWASRWDAYLKMSDPQIHWVSIINSTMITLFLTGMVAMIMLRILKRDVAQYNDGLDDEDEMPEEESGWKVVHTEVFRPPARFAELSVLLGSGTQIFGMSVVTLLFAVLGFLSPANRGGLMTALLLMFVIMGYPAGYYATRFYTMCEGDNWKQNTFWVALSYPGLCFVVFFILNLALWYEESAGTVPFTTLLALLVLWFGISVPMVYLGAFMAQKKPPIEPTVDYNSIPRGAPESEDRPWFSDPYLSALVGGVLPFGAVFVEIFFILSSVWLHQYYYVFGFLLVVFVILVVACAEIAIVMVYFQLCNEDYEWWWRAFMTPGTSALYLFLFSITYFYAKLHIVRFVSGVLFFGYMFLASFTFFILTGSIGFLATFLFLRKIYSVVKLD